MYYKLNVTTAALWITFCDKLRLWCQIATYDVTDLVCGLAVDKRSNMFYTKRLFYILVLIEM